MRGLLSVFLLTISAILGVAAEFTSQALFVELGGPGLVLSLNYELRPTENLGFRAGFGFALLGYTVPIMINLFLFPEPHRLELGLGIASGEFASLFGGPPQSVLLFVGHFGYRYQPMASGLLFRIGFTPIITEDGEFFPWAGISLGYAF